jgi:isoquinoline 1-oxidoreductase beta subunit
LKIDRRTLLIGGGAGVGLIVGYALWPRKLASELGTSPGEQTFGNFIKIARDGRITVAVPQVETGQGIWTALPQIVADELGAAWETVAVEPAPLHAGYANPLAEEEGWTEAFGPLRKWRIESGGTMRVTAGSTSVRAFAQPLREAAAIAREMLIGAAADRWNVGADECEAADGFVISGVRTVGFGELAEEAATRTPPRQPSLRQGTKGRLIGQALQRIDAPAKARGKLRFAADVRLPAMLFASARIAPPGGRLTGFAEAAIRNSPGVRHFAARDQWVAVAADSWWAAETALKAADPKFNGPRAEPDVRPTFEAALAEGKASEWFSRGDYNSAVRGSRPLAATYWAAPSQHLGLEPLSATAQLSGGRMEVWAASQAPEFAHQAAADASGGANTAFYPMPPGDPAGRALEADAIAIVAELARGSGRPVQLSLSQSASQNHDRLSPGALARMMALPGTAGITAAWKVRVVTSGGLGDALGRLAGDELGDGLGRIALDGSVPPYSIPNVAIDAISVRSPFSAGYMRGSPQREFCFFTESFVDELAHAAGIEPLAFRMSMLGSNPRLARCLQAAAQIAQWDGGGRGSTMGLAGCSAFGSHIALVAVATIGEDQRVAAHKFVAVVDCGAVVNSGVATQQIEAGLIWALAQASASSPEFVAGMPRARPMGGIGLTRMADAPEILVKLIPSASPSGGLSGLAPAVVAPALANAISAGTGRRLRSLPFELA